MSFIGYVAYDKANACLSFVNQQPQDMVNQEDFQLAAKFVNLIDIQGPRDAHIYAFGNQYPLCIHFNESWDLKKFLGWFKDWNTAVHYKK